ncbi:aminotransferase class V-fold PLP-dependent enzyme [bacterium]|nr:aminotransferase class V-fold PLP-dependent enzyme [bacterium]
MKTRKPVPETTQRLWTLDPGVCFLNHGSFGACPAPVLAAQTLFRRRMERNPVRFLGCDIEPLLDAARRDLAAFAGASPEDLAFVPNATFAVNAVLRSIPLRRGDEIVVTNHGYNACRNAAEAVAADVGARVVVAKIPFPIRDARQAVDAILGAVTKRTRLVLIDHVTSPTALVLPIEEIVRKLEPRVPVLVDGAHGPGMLPLDLASLGASYYAANLHKWACAPKGAGFLFVREDRRGAIRPLVVSHGRNTKRAGRSRFHLDFDWTGTNDNTPYLCVPEAIRFLATLAPGGLAALYERNRALALRGRDAIADALGIRPPAPDSMIGSMAAFPVPGDLPRGKADALGIDPLQHALAQRGFVVPVTAPPRAPRRVLRVSCHAYNRAEEYEALASELSKLRRAGARAKRSRS